MHTMNLLQRIRSVPHHPMSTNAHHPHLHTPPDLDFWNPEVQVAVIDPRVRVRKTYGQLYNDIDSLVETLLSVSGSWNCERVLNLMPAGYGWILTQFALWSLGAINVPQPTHHPIPELKNVTRAAGVRIGIATEASEDSINRLGLDLVIILSADGLRLIFSSTSSSNKLQSTPPSKLVGSTGGAMMLFTSGTTGIPKGVMITHAAIRQQCLSLGEAWEWSSEDRLFHALPLTHIHGIINAVALPLWYHSTIEFSPTTNFAPADFWSRILMADQPPISVFTAVPTMYSRLIQYHRSSLGDSKLRLTRKMGSRLRVMFSGSAALPLRIRKDWHDLTGHLLLERYGMTETGMILSNRILGERRDGHVGFPLPGVTVRLRDQSTGNILDSTQADWMGEIEVKGRNVFDGYWSVHEQKTVKDFPGSFTSDGYFRTGDLAQRSSLDGSFKLLGRISTDIIKSGGEKISAREIEEVIGRLPGIKDVSVVGVPDPEWGETVACVLALEDDQEDNDVVADGEKKFSKSCWEEVSNLRTVLRSELAPYKLPKLVKVYESDLPRNLMGKVQKPKLARMAFPERYQQP